MSETVARSATDAGVTVVEYHRRAAAGEKWCRAHRQWHPIAQFGTDPKGERGLARSCRASRRVTATLEEQQPPPRRGLSDVPSQRVLSLPSTARESAAAVAQSVSWAWAACLDVDPELFFPAGTDGPGAQQAAEAAAVCAGCPIREGCLRTALAQGEEFGVFGGLTEDERRDVPRDDQVRAS